MSFSLVRFFWTSKRNERTKHTATSTPPSTFGGLSPQGDKTSEQDLELLGLIEFNHFNPNDQNGRHFELVSGSHHRMRH